jgi:hypothetical protein
VIGEACKAGAAATGHGLSNLAFQVEIHVVFRSPNQILSTLTNLDVVSEKTFGSSSLSIARR